MSYGQHQRQGGVHLPVRTLSPSAQHGSIRSEKVVSLQLLLRQLVSLLLPLNVRSLPKRQRSQ